MTFVVIGRDGKDDKALERRMAARDAHLRLGDEMRDRGELLYAVALLDDAGKMVGSVCVVELENRTKVDEWLKREPYVLGGVWTEIEVQAGRVGPSLVK